MLQLPPNSPWAETGQASIWLDRGLPFSAENEPGTCLSSLDVETRQSKSKPRENQRGLREPLRLTMAPLAESPEDERQSPPHGFLASSSCADSCSDAGEGRCRQESGSVVAEEEAGVHLLCALRLRFCFNQNEIGGLAGRCPGWVGRWSRALASPCTS